MTIKEKLYLILPTIFLVIALLQLPEVIIDIRNSIGILGIALCFEIASFIFLLDDYQRKSFDNKCCDFSVLKKED
ncbi:MAG: hypothetical protein KAS01_00660 [Candidatus Pacebacteria bacterium]|nr:hypothetical protein [Candidatus Paceibacterota bacterium]